MCVESGNDGTIWIQTQAFPIIPRVLNEHGKTSGEKVVVVKVALN